jgi:hypothetical protein
MDIYFRGIHRNSKQFFFKYEFLNFIRLDRFLKVQIIMNFTTLSGGSGLTHFEGGCGGGNSFSEISILVSVTKNNLVSMLFKLFLLRR